MNDKDKLRSLYETIKADDYDVPATLEDFEKEMLDADRRKSLYDVMTEDGYEMPSFDDFSADLAPVSQAQAKKSPYGQSATTQQDEQPQPQPQPQEKKVESPAQTYAQAGQETSETYTYGDGTYRPLLKVNRKPKHQTPVVPTPIVPDMDETEQAPAPAPEPASSVGELQADPYLLDKQADEQNRKQQMYSQPNVDANVVKEMRKSRTTRDMEQAKRELETATSQLADIDAKIAKRKNELDKEQNSIKTWLERTTSYIQGQESATDMAPANTSKQFEDNELAMLWATKRNIEDRIGTLEREVYDEGFWTSFGKALTNPSSLTFGLSDIRDAATMVQMGDRELADTDMQDARNRMLQSTIDADIAEYDYSGNDRNLQRFGEIAGTSVPYMLEFILTGGFSGLTTGLSKVTSRAASKLAQKTAIQKMRNTILRKTGEVADDVMRALVMTNTTGSARTTADILEKRQGQVVQSRDGDYEFKDGMSVGKAIYEAEMASLIEYFSEMSGRTLIDPALSKIGKQVGKHATKISTPNMAKMWSRISQSEASQLVDAVLTRAGVNSTLGEILEEEEALILSALLTDSTDWSDVVNARTQLDIVGGIACSVGAMRAVPTAAGAVAHVVDRTGYYTLNHQLNNSDKVASFRLTEEKWKPIKDAIDSTTNEEISDVVSGILAGDMTNIERQAVLTYTINLLKMRGYNLRSTANAVEQIYQNNPSETTDADLAVAQDAEMSANYSMGYNADEQQRRDIFIAAKMAATEEDWELSQEAWRGVEQRIEDDVDTYGQMQVERANSIKNKDGNIHPIELKETNQKGENKRAFVVGGKLVVNADGTVDVEHSDSTIAIVDEDGVRRMISVSGDMGIKSAGSVLSAEDVTDSINRSVQEYRQSLLDSAQCVLSFQVGKNINIPNGISGVIVGVDDSNVLIDTGDGIVTMSKEVLQEIEDERLMDDYVNRRDKINNTTPLEARDETNQEETKDIENQDTTSVQEVEEDVASNVESNVASNVASNVSQGEIAEEATLSPMPMVVDKNGNQKPDFDSVDANRAYQYLYEERGLTADEASAFVALQLTHAEKERAKLAKTAPKMGLDLDEYQAAKDAWQKEADIWDKRIALWTDVKAERDNAKKAILQQREEAERVRHDMAVAEEERRIAEMEAKKAEARQRGSHAVHPAIAEKWASAKKIEGNKNEITLPNGEVVKGQYVLVESGAATPSHNPNNNFAPNEGFPTNENGTTVNDRDYERDKDAQETTRLIAMNYDNRAIQGSPVVVSQDGVVLSGNGRTMAGELAAYNGTDTAYIEYLAQYPQQFGFTPEQIASMQHPRVVFVAEGNIPYTTETFAKFNQSEMKSKSNTEVSVTMGKVVPDNTYRQIVQTISKYDTLAEFYADEKASVQALMMLIHDGVIEPTRRAEMMDGNKLSGLGRQTLENALIGKSFALRPETVRELAANPSMRQAVISALTEIANNVNLGEDYSLESELSQAINLVHQARKNGYKEGESVANYATQLNLFPSDEGESVSDYTNACILMLADLLNSKKTSQLRKVLGDYNNKAIDSANGQIDIFGEIQTREQILKEVIDFYRNANKNEQQQAEKQAIAERKQRAKDAEASQEDGTAQDGDGLSQYQEYVDRARHWEQKVGVKVNLITDISQVTNTSVIDAIQQGHAVTGWFDTNTGEVYLYLPNIRDIEDIDKTYTHEVVAHKGIKELLGEEKFKEFLSEVWTIMSNEDKAKYMSYPGVTTWQEAADEYVAHLAEGVDLTLAEQSTWKKIIQKLVDILSSLGFKGMTYSHVEDLVRASYLNLSEKASGASVGVIDNASGQIKFRFIGEVGAENLDRAEEATTRLDNLAVAREMEIANKDAKTIKMATGWERGADGKWRYETEDIDISATEKKLRERLLEDERNDEEKVASAVVYKDEIQSVVDEYPDWNVDILVYVGQRYDNTGSYNPGYEGDNYYSGYTPSIEIKAKTVSDVRRLLSHEIQHAIQEIEGFAEGGSLSSAYEEIEDVKYTLGIQDKASISDIVSYLEHGFETPVQNRAINDLAKKKGYNNAIDYVRSLNPFNYYRHLSGEVEARNVESRLDMTPEQRRQSLASETEDVAREDQIFLKGALSVSASESLESESEGNTVDDINSGNINLEEGSTKFRIIENQALIDKLESEPKIKVYRAMQMIDGKLYPPMSAKVNGKLREPIELGKWEMAEEQPELADDKGYFKLDKGNKKSLKARYNPYFHTSTTPLNDQFSSAQSRPELVTVEVEIPESELTSGYKAEKAKDSVGKVEWKAGAVQSKLSGTRTVILSRYDKPIRIVPDSEVADEIVKMFEGKDITMPSNVVTPSLRAELEKRGVPFVETDNQGNVIEGTRFRVEDELVAVHNLSEDKLRKVLEMGGLIMPSIAITRADMGHDNFGEISLLFDKSTIDPSDRRNKVFGGDAWTPRIPQLIPKLNEKASARVKSKIQELIDNRALAEMYSLSSELHQVNIDSTITERGVKGYYSKEWMKHAYLLDNGKKVKIPMKAKDYGTHSEMILELLKEKGLKASEINKNTYDFYKNNPDVVEDIKNRINEKKANSVSEDKREAVLKLLNERGISFQLFDTLIRSAAGLENDLENGGKKQIIDRDALRETINKKVKTDNADYNKWVDNLFEGIVEKYGIRNKTDWYTPSGTLRSWEKLYDAATPENILRYMLVENEQGGSGGFWDSDIMGASAETYESIGEIREKGQKRLRRVDSNEYNEWATSVANRVSEISSEFLTDAQRNDFGGIIDAKIAITNAVAKDKTAKGIYKKMKADYPNFTMEHANRVVEIVKEIQDYAIGYFEAKPQRIVPLSEVRKAIVPSNVSEDILEGLQNNGIEVATYRKGNEASRQRLIKKESNGIRFRVTEEMDAEYMDAVNGGNTSTAQNMVDEVLENAGYTIRGEHGTTHKFTIFSNVNANIENSFGKGFYFTSDRNDAETNYASDEGANLTNRIELLAERMEYEDGYEDMNYEERLAEARNRLSGGENLVISAAIRMENPCIFSYDPDGVYQETIFDVEENYDEETDEYGEPEGLLVDFVESLNNVLTSGEYYGADRVDAYELIYDGGYTADQLKKKVDEMLMDISDEDGNIASSEIFRAALEDMGFDGIIDNAPSQRFKNMGLSRNTKHYIAFKPNQIKQSDAVTYDNEGNVIPLSERFNPESNDIRFRVANENQEIFVSNAQKAVEGIKQEKATPEQQRRFAERERKRMVDHIQTLAQRMNLNNVQIVTDNNQLQGKRATSKGFYDTNTRTISIVIPNHISMEDAEQTLLHEAVAHHGLRELFGTHFDTFLQNIFENASASVKGKIIQLAGDNGWDFNTATEEYLASLAETTDFENTDAGWWTEIKRAFFQMLHKLGFRNLSDNNVAPISDNEIRYILWRSYQNMVNPGRYRSLVDEAMDVAMQYSLGVGEYASNTDDGVLFRIDTEESVMQSYENMLKSGVEQFIEATQDSMRSLHNFYKAVLGKDKGFRIDKDVKPTQNAYLAENAMHSANAAQIHEWNKMFIEPIVKAVSNLGVKNKKSYDELTDYLMAKHGLERNVVFARRDAEHDYNEHVEMHPNTKMTLDDFIEKHRRRDYAGLTALTQLSNVAEAEAMATEIVQKYEETHDVTELWEAINQATKFSLYKAADSGLMSPERYHQVLGMFEYYIPLQGFASSIAEDVYDYIGSDGTMGYGKPIRHAKGRKSKADDPLATIAMNGEASIRQGNRNLMKQKFLAFVENNPNELTSISDVWLQYNEVTEEWEQVAVDNLLETDTGEEVAVKVAEFEERMKELAKEEPNKYMRAKDNPNIPYRVIRDRNKKQHQVTILRGGRSYVVTINGNPRVAQAVNGLSNPDVFTESVFGKMMNILQTCNRWLSLNYTSRSLFSFVPSNFSRDMIYSNTMAWVKQDPKYAMRFNLNCGKYNVAMMMNLFSMWENGKLMEKVESGRASKSESMFYEFMINGGETGWTSLADIEKHKKKLHKAIMRERNNAAKFLKWLGGSFDILNRGIENVARFAAFTTSREMNKSIPESIYDAKEVSVNFNKKGARDKFLTSKNQTLLGKVGSVIGGFGGGLYVFFNAAVQGLNNIAKASKNNPIKAGSMFATLFMLGYIMPILSRMFKDDDDDEDSYYNIPEYIRRGNICFRWDDNMAWVKIPLPHEFRAIYGLGELTYGVTTGNEYYRDDELAKQYISQLSQVLPLDFMEGGGGFHSFIPSSIKPIVEAETNKSWTGLPIYRDNHFTPYSPQWKLAYESANRQILDFTKWVNETSGGDDVTQGKLDLNPAKIEHILKGYLGGYFKMADQIIKTAETISGERDLEYRNIPVASVFLHEGDERTESRKVKNEYYDYRNEYKETQYRINNYEKMLKDESIGFVEMANYVSLLHDKAYHRYLAMDELNALHDRLNKEKKESGADVENLKKQEDEVRQISVDLIRKINEEYSVSNKGTLVDGDGNDVDVKDIVNEYFDAVVSDESYDENIRNYIINRRKRNLKSDIQEEEMREKIINGEPFEIEEDAE